MGAPKRARAFGLPRLAVTDAVRLDRVLAAIVADDGVLNTYVRVHMILSY